MLAEVREELDRIERFLMRGDKASGDLAMLLSGLRGPDAPHEQILKDKYTCPLRSAMFPMLYSLAQSYEGKMHTTRSLHKHLPGQFCWGMLPGSELPRAVSFANGSGSHYLIHIQAAIDAVFRQ